MGRENDASADQVRHPALERLLCDLVPSPGAVLIIGTVGCGKTLMARVVQRAMAEMGLGTAEIADDTNEPGPVIRVVSSAQELDQAALFEAVERAGLVLVLHVQPSYWTWAIEDAMQRAGFRVEEWSRRDWPRIPMLAAAGFVREHSPELVQLELEEWATLAIGHDRRPKKVPSGLFRASAAVLPGDPLRFELSEGEVRILAGDRTVMRVEGEEAGVVAEVVEALDQMPGAVDLYLAGLCNGVRMGVTGQVREMALRRARPAVMAAGPAASE